MHQKLHIFQAQMEQWGEKNFQNIIGPFDPHLTTFVTYPLKRLRVSSGGTRRRNSESLIYVTVFKMENEISITKYSSYSGMSFFEPYSTAIQLHGFIQ